jgi:hypothetical protein
VNCDATGHLRGYAYSGNIGWLAFESLGNPCVNLTNGVLSGHIYSANCGWISVSNAFAFVQTDSMPGGADTDGDGLADAWEWLSFGGLFASANADTDGDGTSNYQEYHAGTSPTNALDVFKITACSPAADGTSAVLQWNSVVTRKYRVLKSENFAAANWPDAGLGLITPTGATTTVTLSDSIAPARSFRVQAVRLLAP